jgi:hypothetical protein
MSRIGIRITLFLATTCAPIFGAESKTTGSFNLESDQPATVRFLGSDSAELFTREIAESYLAVLSKNFVAKQDGPLPPGFLHASPIPQGWSKTFWTRDGGTFMRELLLWGYTEHACMTADCLMKLVGTTTEGFHAYPEYFDTGNAGAVGAELDGHAAIIISMVMLWQRLPAGHPFKERLYNFLHGKSSPVRFLVSELERGPLLAGSGEFGPGCCGLKGRYYNCVQNSLCMLALQVAADLEAQAGDDQSSRLFRRNAQQLEANMIKYLLAPDGGWFWCLDPKTMKPDPALEKHEINVGFGGINGVACMYSDVLGLEPIKAGWSFADPCMKTFDRLYAFPLRKQQFEKYGIWTQFDTFRGGLSTGPSYGDGYALQTMLLFDKMAMADRSLNWLATSTYEPTKSHKIRRESPYWFYEQYFSPDAEGKIDMHAGCGALNLINVTEPIKAARLIVGIDDTSTSEVRLVPRVPASWSGYEATNWPIRTNAGVVRADIRCVRNDTGTSLSVNVRDGGVIPAITVRLDDQGGYVRQTCKNLSRYVFENMSR